VGSSPLDVLGFSSETQIRVLHVREDHEWLYRAGDLTNFQVNVGAEDTPPGGVRAFHNLAAGYRATRLCGVPPMRVSPLRASRFDASCRTPGRAEDAPDDLGCSAVTFPDGVGVDAQRQGGIGVSQPFCDRAHVDTGSFLAGWL
jgi:hypothetical protein